MRQAIFLLMFILILGCGDSAKSAENKINNSSLEQVNLSTKSIEDSLLRLRERINIIEDKLNISQSNIERIKAEIDNINSSANDANSQAISLFFLSIIINLIVLFVAIFFILKKNPSKYNVPKQVLESDMFKEDLRQRFNNVVLPEKELKKIDARVKNLIRLHKSKAPNHIAEELQSNININDIVYEPTKTIRYLSGIDGKRFNNVDTSPDNSFFKIINEKGDTAEFDFSGNQAEAIAKKVFNEHISIIISGNQKTAQSVKTIKRGKIKRMGDYWEVISPIEVELS